MEQRRGFQPIINKKAHHDYQVVETLVAGIVLTGAEAKSVRLGQASLKNSYVLIGDKQAAVHQMVISPYKFARNEDYEPQRPRTLLLKHKEIEHLRGVSREKRASLVPLKIFLKGGKFKVELGVVRGKKQYEKREAIKKRDLRREVEKEFRGAKYNG